ncbi:hypothetical protein C8J56DRAFT_262016 [Mycena floridula]|nr:hypothetical protein C8J56DRAFT_262016 [Mycena floridula]
MRTDLCVLFVFHLPSYLLLYPRRIQSTRTLLPSVETGPRFLLKPHQSALYATYVEKTFRGRTTESATTVPRMTLEEKNMSVKFVGNHFPEVTP